MKKIILTVLLASAAMGNNNNNNNAAVCKDYAKLGKVSMQLRQNGLSVVDAIGTIKHHELDFIIIEAYKEPRWHTKERKNEAAVEFENRVYLDCIRRIK